MQPRALSRLSAFVQIGVLAVSLALGCKQSHAPSASPPPLSAPAAVKPYPSSPAQAEEMKKGGASWTNEEIRAYYVKIVTTIGPANEEWKKDGFPAEVRARKAFEIRQNARLTGRAMMSSREEVDDLRKRDQEKYGNPDGPTFVLLLEKAKQKGKAGDALYDSIIESAQRTDQKTNQKFGIQKAP